MVQFIKKIGPIPAWPAVLALALALAGAATAWRGLEAERGALESARAALSVARGRIAVLSRAPRGAPPPTREEAGRLLASETDRASALGLAPRVSFKGRKLQFSVRVPPSPGGTALALETLEEVIDSIPLESPMIILKGGRAALTGTPRLRER